MEGVGRNVEGKGTPDSVTLRCKVLAALRPRAPLPCKAANDLLHCQVTAEGTASVPPLFGELSKMLQGAVAGRDDSLAGAH